jgi:syntaxin 5
MAVSSSIQDRTSEFHSVLTQVQKQRHSNKIGAQRQSLLSTTQKAENGSATAEKPRRSEFARRAAEIGRGISGTMAKLEKLAQCTPPHCISPVPDHPLTPPQ